MYPFFFLYSSPHRPQTSKNRSHGPSQAHSHTQTYATYIRTHIHTNIMPSITPSSACYFFFCFRLHRPLPTRLFNRIEFFLFFIFYFFPYHYYYPRTKKKEIRKHSYNVCVPLYRVTYFCYTSCNFFFRVRVNFRQDNLSEKGQKKKKDMQVLSAVREGHRRVGLHWRTSMYICIYICVYVF